MNATYQLCERRTVYEEDDPDDGGVKCHQDATGVYWLRRSDGKTLALMQLCQPCAENFQERFGEVDAVYEF